MTQDPLSESKKIDWLKKELALANAKFISLLENIPRPIAMYKAVEDGNDFVFTYFNPLSEVTDKLSREEVIGKKITEVFPGVSDFGLLKVFQEVWKSGQAQFHPIRLYKDDRIHGWRDNHVFKLPDGAIVEAYLDKTKDQKILEELARAKALFSQTIQRSPIGLLILDIESGDATT
jgi:PAS domain-containing protein